MAWIECHQELGRHPKTKRLARALQISLPTAVGHLTFLWWWATDYAQSGDLTEFTDEDIADAAAWEGDPRVLMDALVTTRFIDRDGDGMRIHDWYEYAGRLIEQREKNRNRSKRAYNARKQAENDFIPDDDADSTQSLREEIAQTTHDQSEVYGATKPDLTKPNLTRPDLTRQDTTTPLHPAGVDAEEAAAAPQMEPVPYKKIMELYNATCTRLRKIKTIDGERRKAVTARFKTYGIDTFIKLFEKANTSEFLCGGGAKNWSADFDWLMNATNIAKVLEGKYDNQTNLPPIPPTLPTHSRSPTNSNGVDTMSVLNRIITQSERGDYHGDIE